MTTHTRTLPNTGVIRTWLDSLPPLLALPPTEEPVPEPAVEETLVVVMPGRFWSWLLWFFPFGEEITRKQAAAHIMACEIHVQYAPLIVELDRENPNVEIR